MFCFALHVLIDSSSTRNVVAGKTTGNKFHIGYLVILLYELARFAAL